MWNTFWNRKSWNYAEFEKDWTLHSVGDATTWDDVVWSLLGRSLSSNLGKADYDWDEQAVKMQPWGSPTSANDRVLITQQIPHKVLVDSWIKPHVHREQISTDNIQFNLEYRIQKNWQAKTTAWTTITADSANNAFAYIGGTMIQITGFPTIDTTWVGLSATIQFRLTRTDNTADDILLTFFDYHAKFDTMWSRKEYVK